MSGDVDVKARRWGRTAVWLPGLAVAVGAAVATAHGLFEVAVAARVPTGIAWIYPLITDGLALVAYAATARLSGSAARYAWSVVIVSAGLSGLAQASYLASDAVALGDGLAVSPALRFGVGAWPAVAAAVVAHLLYLLADADTERGRTTDGTAAYRASGSTGTGVHRSPRSAVQASDEPVHSALDASAPAALLDPAEGPPERPFTRAEPSAPEPSGSGPGSERPTARERARDAARAHHARHRGWPTVTELQESAGVSRGTASAALRDARNTTAAPTPLHLISNQPVTEPPSDTHESDQP